MRFSTFMYKLTARNGLKGDWQTPMLLSFISTLFFTAANVLGSMKIPDAYQYVSRSGVVDALGFLRDVQAVPQWVWFAFYALVLVGILLTPVLSISLRAYLLARLQGQNLGLLKGLTMRFSVWGKALWLYVRMFVQIFLWGLLLIVPGILAAIRYAMAPFYLAQHPEMSVKECLEASKALMKHRKAEYALLYVSFLLWNVSINYGQMILLTMGLPSVLVMVLAQFAALTLTVYITTSYAAYYAMNSSAESLCSALDGIRRKMSESGMPEENREQMESMLKMFVFSVQQKNEAQAPSSEELVSDEKDQPSEAPQSEAPSDQNHTDEDR